MVSSRRAPSLPRLLIRRYPPDTEEKQKNLGGFFGKNPPSGVAGAMPGYVKAVKEQNSSITKFGVLGVSDRRDK